MPIVGIVVITILVWIVLLIVFFILAFTFECLESWFEYFWDISKFVFFISCIAFLILPIYWRFTNGRSYNYNSYRSSNRSSYSNSGGSSSYRSSPNPGSSGRSFYTTDSKPLSFPSNTGIKIGDKRWDKYFTDSRKGDKKWDGYFNISLKKQWNKLPFKEQRDHLYELAVLERICDTYVSRKERELELTNADPNNVELKELKEEREFIKKRREKLHRWWEI